MPSKGSTNQRGYGAPHQNRRKHFAPMVAAGHYLCQRCNEPIRPDQEWDLGHQDLDRSAPSYPEHRHAVDCKEGGNRATKGRYSRRPNPCNAPALSFFDTPPPLDPLGA